MDVTYDVSRAAVFEDIPPEVIEDLCSRGRVSSFDVGQQIFERGQAADELFVLREGVVDLLFPVQILGATRELTLESKQAGDVVAWSALVRPYRFTLSARCARKCILTGLGRDLLHRFFEADPATGYLFMRNLAGVIGQRLHGLQTLWVQDLQSSARRRLES